MNIQILEYFSTAKQHKVECAGKF